MRVSNPQRIAAILVAMVAVLLGNPVQADVVQLSAREFHRVLQTHGGDPDFILLDIRTPKEYAQGHIAGATLLDYYHPGFIDGLKRLDKSRNYLIYCRSGNRTGRTLKLMEKMGFFRVYHLRYGIIDWNRQRLPLVKP